MLSTKSVLTSKIMRYKDNVSHLRAVVEFYKTLWGINKFRYLTKLKRFKNGFMSNFVIDVKF